MNSRMSERARCSKGSGTSALERGKVLGFNSGQMVLSTRGSGIKVKQLEEVG